MLPTSVPAECLKSAAAKAPTWSAWQSTCPKASSSGIDLSQTAIARATELAKQAGVENVTFRQVDVAELVGRPGECDYVIAHGVFSWVPREVQDKILELCERVLAPTGIAYISYNTYPGWHVREMMAEMMRFHTSGIEDPETAVTEGLGRRAGSRPHSR